MTKNEIQEEVEHILRGAYVNELPVVRLLSAGALGINFTLYTLISPTIHLVPNPSKLKVSAYIGLLQTLRDQCSLLPHFYLLLPNLVIALYENASGYLPSPTNLYTQFKNAIDAYVYTLTNYYQDVKTISSRNITVSLTEFIHTLDSREMKTAFEKLLEIKLFLETHTLFPIQSIKFEMDLQEKLDTILSFCFESSIIHLKGLVETNVTNIIKQEIPFLLFTKDEPKVYSWMKTKKNETIHQFHSQQYPFIYLNPWDIIFSKRIYQIIESGYNTISLSQVDEISQNLKSLLQVWIKRTTTWMESLCEFAEVYIGNPSIHSRIALIQLLKIRNLLLHEHENEHENLTSISLFCMPIESLISLFISRSSIIEATSTRIVWVLNTILEALFSLERVSYSLFTVLNAKQIEKSIHHDDTDDIHDENQTEKYDDEKLLGQRIWKIIKPSLIAIRKNIGVDYTQEELFQSLLSRATVQKLLREFNVTDEKSTETNSSSLQTDSSLFSYPNNEDTLLTSSDRLKGISYLVKKPTWELWSYLNRVRKTVSMEKSDYEKTNQTFSNYDVDTCIDTIPTFANLTLSWTLMYTVEILSNLLADLNPGTSLPINEGEANGLFWIWKDDFPLLTQEKQRIQHISSSPTSKKKKKNILSPPPPPPPAPAPFLSSTTTERVSDRPIQWDIITTSVPTKEENETTGLNMSNISFRAKITKYGNTQPCPLLNSPSAALSKNEIRIFFLLGIFRYFIDTLLIPLHVNKLVKKSSSSSINIVTINELLLYCITQLEKIFTLSSNIRSNQDYHRSLQSNIKNEQDISVWTLNHCLPTGSTQLLAAPNPIDWIVSMTCWKHDLLGPRQGFSLAMSAVSNQTLAAGDFIDAASASLIELIEDISVAKAIDERRAQSSRALLLQQQQQQQQQLNSNVPNDTLSAFETQQLLATVLSNPTPANLATLLTALSKRATSSSNINTNATSARPFEPQKVRSFQSNNKHGTNNINDKNIRKSTTPPPPPLLFPQHTSITFIEQVSTSAVNAILTQDPLTVLLNTMRPTFGIGILVGNLTLGYPPIIVDSVFNPLPIPLPDVPSIGSLNIVDELRIEIANRTSTDKESFSTKSTKIVHEKNESIIIARQSILSIPAFST